MQRTDSFIFDAKCEEIRSAVQGHFLQRVESFELKEDSPGASPYHPDERIQNAIKPAMLLVSASGKEILLEVV